MISEELKAQIDRLNKTGSFSITMDQKHELSRITKDAGLALFNNLNCGTCVRDAMYNVGAWLKQQNERPKLQLKAVKPIDALSFQELKQRCKAKGIDFKRTDNKEALLNKLK